MTKRPVSVAPRRRDEASMEDRARARALFTAGHNDEALEIFRRVLAKHPNDLDSIVGAGTIHLLREEGGPAYSYLSRAVRHMPNEAALLTAVGAACRLNGRLPEAERYHARAIKADPALADTYYNLGRVYMDTLNYFGASSKGNPTAEAARQAFQKYVKLSPTSADGWNQLGALLIMTEDFSGAVDALKKSLALKPNHPASFENMGTVMQLTGEDGAAEGYFYLAAANSKDDKRRVHMKLAQFLLKRGRFGEGWDYFDARLLHNAYTIPELFPRWQGESLAGKALLLIDEQGVGDSILFASMIGELIERAKAEGGRIVLFTRAGLVVPLFRSFTRFEPPAGTDLEKGIHATDPATNRCYLLVRAVQWTKPETWPKVPADFQAPLGSLGKILRRTAAAFPAAGGYLKAAKARALDIRERYRTVAAGKPLVGISWKSYGRELGSQKTTPLQDWAGVLALPGFIFVSVQYGKVADDIEALGDALGPSGPAAALVQGGVIVDPAINAVADLEGSIAQIAAMDAVITTSSTTAHIAGALNVPTLLILPAGRTTGTLWYWMQEGSRTPWYPSVRIFRAQPGATPWHAGPLAAVRETLTTKGLHR